MNNRQNGRNRRGRGGPQRIGGQGGQRPDPGNRMESRQRGNAHQLHEKYKNLARDATTQGDRVTAEYYLQFADHYFRVLNEHRSRQEEFRQRQREHEQRYDDGGEDDGVGDDMDAGTMIDDDPTAPIAINGLPPAIGNAVSAAPRESVSETESNGDGDEPGYGRESRGRNNDEQSRPSRPRGRPPRAARPDPEDEAVRPSESAEASEEALKPRRRTRRPRAAEAEGDTVAEADI